MLCKNAKFNNDEITDFILKKRKKKNYKQIISIYC